MHAAWHVADTFRTERSGGRAGLAPQGALRPVLRAPANWRERMLLHDGASEMSSLPHGVETLAWSPPIDTMDAAAMGDTSREHASTITAPSEPLAESARRMALETAHRTGEPLRSDPPSRATTSAATSERSPATAVESAPPPLTKQTSATAPDEDARRSTRIEAPRDLAPTEPIAAASDTPPQSAPNLPAGTPAMPRSAPASDAVAPPPTRSTVSSPLASSPLAPPSAPHPTTTQRIEPQTAPSPLVAQQSQVNTDARATGAHARSTDTQEPLSTANAQSLPRELQEAERQSDRALHPNETAIVHPPLAPRTSVAAPETTGTTVSRLPPATSSDAPRHLAESGGDSPSEQPSASHTAQRDAAQGPRRIDDVPTPHVQRPPERSTRSTPTSSVQDAAAPTAPPSESAPPALPSVQPPPTRPAVPIAQPVPKSFADDAEVVATRDVEVTAPAATEVRSESSEHRASTPEATAREISHAPQESAALETEVPIQSVSEVDASRSTGETAALTEDVGGTARRPIEVRRGRRPPDGAKRNIPSDTTKSEEPSTPRPAPAAEAEPSEPAVTREMADWRRLLFEATRDPSAYDVPSATPPKMMDRVAERTAQRTAERAAEPPSTHAPTSQTIAPLLESTRRFLSPRIGIDPATVPIIRGPEGDRLLAAANADAAAIGEAIALPSTNDERAPSTLGLLAHELTHVAQRRQPRFVPPILRAHSANVEPAHQRPHQPAHEPTQRALSTSEESLARRVEHAVRKDAEQAAEQAHRAAPLAQDARTKQTPTKGIHPLRDGEIRPWGTLPAPWEPLEHDSPPEGDASASFNAVTTTLFAAPSADAAPVHFAEHGRSPEAEASSPDHGAPPTAAPAQDLDALARRVYDVLKRRLAAERRREG